MEGEGDIRSEAAPLKTDPVNCDQDAEDSGEDEIEELENELDVLIEDKNYHEFIDHIVSRKE